MSAKRFFVGVLGAALVLATLPAGALFIETSYVGTDQGGGLWNHDDESRLTGRNLSSSVQFTQSGNELLVLLSNNSSDYTSVRDDVLQGVFFNASGIGNPAASVEFGPGSDFSVPGDGIEENLDGWNYRNDLDTSSNPFNEVYGVDHGIANPGLDTFGPHNTFANYLGLPNPWPIHPPYGIVSSAGEDITGPGPWVQNSLLFTFDVDNTFDMASISNVVFHYSTSADIIPEPMTMSLLGMGLAGLGVRQYRRKRANKA